MNIRKYFALAFLAIILSSCDNSSIERQQLLDFDWEFSLDNSENWQKIDLPHDWSIKGDFAESNAMGDAGGYLPDGIGTYRKTLTLDKSYKHKKIYLYFEGSYMQTSVKVNGLTVGSHDYGYTSFNVDITPFVQVGDNQIEVIVDNSQQQNCRWYSGSGIFRHVWLVTTNWIHLKQWNNVIITPRINSSLATVWIKTTVMNETEKDKDVTVRADITDGYYVEKDVSLAAHSEKEVSLVVDVYEPKLWSCDTPNLYEAKITVKSGRKVLDTQTETFGIRSFVYSAEEGAKLNGKPITIFGGCIHHDNGILGSAAYDRAEERKVEMMKDAGFNAVRTSHNPVSEAFLNACDRLGLLVIDEAFDGWYEPKTTHDYHKFIDTHWQSDIAAMVMRDRNHPSIISWSIGNEIIERERIDAVMTASKFSWLCRKLDPTRPVTEALACWNGHWVIQDSLAARHDIVGYNYLLDWAEEDHKRVPDRIIWQTESYPRDAFKNWKLVSANPYIIGDFVWTAIDYLGESSIGRWYYEGDTPGEHYQGTHFPWHGAYCGDIDITGWRKPVSYYRQLLFAPETAADLHIAVREPDGYFGKIKETQWSVWPTWDSWNWEGWEGKPIEVEVYSKYPAVRLYLNNEIIGEHKTNEDNGFLAVFKVPYSKGTLKAEGIGPSPITPLLCNSNLCDSVVTLSTAEEPACIRLSADRAVLNADGQDLAFVTIEIVDKNGNVCPNAEIPLTASLASSDISAAILAFGNANLQDCDPYYNLTHKTWKGRAMLVVKAGMQPSDITLKVASESQEASIVISTK